MICLKMIAEDISKGKENVKVPVVNELNDEKPSEFRYTPFCIGGPNVSDAFNLPFYNGCRCQLLSCTTDICSCLERYGPFYDEDGCLQIYNQPTDYCQPVFECNSRCACSGSCPNRVVQKGQQLNLQVFKTKHKGWGLRTLESIKKFTFVCEYAGELISTQEAKKRAQELTHETGNYLIVLREHSSKDQVFRTHVDARFHGNASRFVNHSCSPNLIMVPVRVDSLVPRLALFTARNIDIGEELSFDYSGEFEIWPAAQTTREHVKGLEVLRDFAKEPKSCCCGSQGCRSVLPFESSLYSL